MKFWFNSFTTDYNSDEGLNENKPFEMKRINILVGSNNSGKSRFMRALLKALENKSLVFQRPNDYLELRENLKKFLLEETGLKIDSSSLHDEKLSKYSLLESELLELTLFMDSFIDNYFNSRNDIQIDLRNKLQRQANIFLSRVPNRSEFLQILNEFQHKISGEIIQNSFLEIKNIEQMNFNNFYIPSLRSLKSIYTALSEEKFDMLFPAKTQKKEEERLDFKNNSLDKPFKVLAIYDYNLKDKQVITGEGFFEDIMESLLGKPAQRKRIDEYQKKLSHYFFNNQEVTIIPNIKENALEIKIGNDEQYPIAHLGDGLQQVIILTYTPFLITQKSMFFIEEPEMHLHAGYVKQIVKFLLNETEHTYFMTTHSNYLLDMINESNQVTLYRVDKKESAESDETKIHTVIKRCDQDRSILQVLGVKPSSVFLANCTIWVEGITDRLYIIEYMKKYLQELENSDKEKYQNYSRFIDGYHYAFVEYQGANLGHWNFDVELIKDVRSGEKDGLNALLVTTDALVIADKDILGKSNFKKVRLQLGFKIYTTNGKETENTLPLEVLKNMFYQLCPNSGLASGKEKLAEQPLHNQYFTNIYESSDLGIGAYYNDILANMRSAKIFKKLASSQKSYEFNDGGQGTIKNKTDFCRNAVNLMQDQEFDWQLTDSAKQLCERIFTHIEDCNREFEN